VRLHGLQSRIAQRYSGARGGFRWTYFPHLFGRVCFPAEARQNALGSSQLIELISELCPFGIDDNVKAAQS
jgi:hypothetical protein